MRQEARNRAKYESERDKTPAAAACSNRKLREELSQKKRGESDGRNRKKVGTKRQSQRSKHEISSGNARKEARREGEKKSRNGVTPAHAETRDISEDKAREQIEKGTKRQPQSGGKKRKKKSRKKEEAAAMQQTRNLRKT
jgi:hypothetical protein